MEADNNFVFLIQGRHLELGNFAFLKNPDSKIITLSWDKPGTKVFFQDHHYYLPKSTWAEGRNFLLVRAIELYPNLEYVIFMDGDLQIASGSIDEFKEFLKIYKPVLGLPLSNQLKETLRFLPNSRVQTQVSFDQVMQAYSRTAIEDGICLPYLTDLDHLSWWYSCEINQYLTVKYYEKETLQWNSLLVNNTHHTTQHTGALGSKYVGGITKIGIRECKKIIENRFGKQGLLIGTLFQPGCLPKPLNRDFKVHNSLENKREWTTRGILRIIYLNQALAYAKILKMLFRKKYPVQESIVGNGG